MTIAITRRTALGAAAYLATLGLSDALAADSGPRMRVRLLETSDLHMFVMDWDYYHAKPDPTVGLTRVATLIRAARRESPNTLLFDNGDFLQGNPLADYIAAQPPGTEPHPLVATMTALGYDAAGLGNHEFNYGLDFLEATVQNAPFAFVCANVVRAGGAPFLPPYTILQRVFKDETGAEHELRIGVISFLPPQIMSWDKARLEGKVEASDIVLTARRLVPELRAKCDVVVALCHSGIGTGAWAEGEEHAALHLAAVPGIDAILLGHAHRVFPGKDYASADVVDAVAGRLHGVPAVMPGFWGSHLGVIDLGLRRDGERWIVEKADVEARPIYRREGGTVHELTTADGAVTASIAAAHRGTLGWIEQPAGALDAPIHSYFVWAGYDPTTALVNAAQIAYAKPLLAAAGFGELPLLSAAAPYRVGYTPDSFIDIPAGPVPMRAVADLYIYSSNTVTVVKATGAQIVAWLEWASRVFNTIDPSGAGSQPLVNRKIPSYNFDTIAGLTYAINVTKPSGRIADVRFEGKPLDLTREFAVVTNNYRADGGGGFAALKDAEILLRAPDTNRDAVFRYFGASPTVHVHDTTPWRFAPAERPVEVWFDTGTAAAPLIAGRKELVLLGDGEPGYARVGMFLGREI
ncbi:bifunctional 2',3'-cyclic-nucleotide 2'-phosphodiesterase/3'-nucleotidase [Rhodomicrobium vannielii ATCC 17100]|uniref:bifunctional 2',3'-cyclic-nucleotide 2'-phosphodiesterase/3'-nucleotidase n=1 Tax=Rhodomicrobium vannielii TaxID=1069 RepID=UPI001919499B|nr:bifunctional 2',3'-cyclic-nucleotide 2'-phosphodiesterase/3'-nucleotidase [Rhodomicrobium vannielii]MBJ7532743.1 bifunctional 2',3'-cyclic-nucleotide 2'-phosphodiesterase/3'-nucleotidase [Rhodomicrobium vannielii ATCC 17100]